MDKLEAVRDEIGAPADTPLVVADADDGAAVGADLGAGAKAEARIGAMKGAREGVRAGTWAREETGLGARAVARASMGRRPLAQVVEFPLAVMGGSSETARSHAARVKVEENSCFSRRRLIAMRSIWSMLA